MKNVSKAEMSKEIKRLQNLVDSMCIAARDFRKEIEDLEDSVRQRDALITAKDKENGQLRLQLESADRVGTKYASKIRDLEADKWRLYDLEDEYRKEIKNLREAVAELGGVISEKDSEIKRLHQHIDDDEISILNKQNEINNLHCEVKLLKGTVADLEQKRNDSRKFHYATEALGNPLHFQRVSGD